LVYGLTGTIFLPSLVFAIEIHLLSDVRTVCSAGLHQKERWMGAYRGFSGCLP